MKIILLPELVIDVRSFGPCITFRNFLKTCQKLVIQLLTSYKRLVRHLFENCNKLLPFAPVVHLAIFFNRRRGSARLLKLNRVFIITKKK